MHRAEEDAVAVARALLSLARDAGMPDTYQQSDRRMRLARRVVEKYAPARKAKNKKKGQDLMAKKEKTPRIAAFTARELIVALAKCAPSARVHFVAVDPAFPQRLMPDEGVAFPVTRVEERRDAEGGGEIVALGTREAT